MGAGLVVGLGNPGPEYEGTRHNLGFEVVGELARRCAVEAWLEMFRALCVPVRLGGRTVVLMMPQVYVNNSGVSVAAALSYYNAPPRDVCVVCDDVNLPVGKIRVRARGSSGGHNGLESVIRFCRTEEFPRLRIGIGRPGGDLVSHVLGRYGGEEKEILAEAVKRAADAVVVLVNEGVDACMNRYN